MSLSLLDERIISQNKAWRNDRQPTSPALPPPMQQTPPAVNNVFFTQGSEFYPCDKPKYFDDIDAGDITPAQGIHNYYKTMDPTNPSEDWKKEDNQITNNLTRVEKAIKAYDDKHELLLKQVEDVKNNRDALQKVMLGQVDDEIVNCQGKKMLAYGALAEIALQDEERWRPKFEAENNLLKSGGPCRSELKKAKARCKEWDDIRGEERMAQIRNQFESEERATKRQRLRTFN